MKVVQSVFGKFHHFHLARQLYKRDMLQAIYSTYPRWKLSHENIPGQLIHSFPFFHLAWFANQKFGIADGRLSNNLSWMLALSLDAYAARTMPECDVFIGISGSGYKSGRLVQSRGGAYICDRGSSHIRFREDIIREELNQWAPGEYRPTDPRHIVREELEYDCADIITVPSAYAVRSYVSLGIPSDKLQQIAYGADLRNFSKTADPDPARFEVLYVGGIRFAKGVHYLIQAFASFNHPNKRLRIVGSVLPEIKNFLASAPLENVEIVGPMPHSELKEIMSRSHVMVMPSLDEGFGLVVGEAMACGCPVICSENTGGEHILTDGMEGFIVPSRNSQVITDRLEQLAQDSNLRDRMSELSIVRVSSIGGWDRYGDEFAGLLHRITIH